MTTEMQDAKDIVIKQAQELADILKNGNAADLNTHGKAIGLIIDMVCPIFNANLVTLEDCKRNQEECRIHNIALNKEVSDGITDLSVGPVHIKGRVNALMVMVIILTAGVVFAIGKSENWW